MAGSPESPNFWVGEYLDYHDGVVEQERESVWNFETLQQRVSEIYEAHDERYKYGAPMMLARITGNVHHLKEAIKKEPDNHLLLEKSLTNVVIWTLTLANYVYLDVQDPLTEKFGSGCPRCHQIPCTLASEGVCIKNPDAPWGNAGGKKPQTIEDWQTHLTQLYPNNYWGEPQEILAKTASRLGDEVEELIASNDLSLIDDDNRMSHHDIPLDQQPAWKGEFADVLAWSMAVAEALNRKTGGNFSLEKSLHENYKNGCPFCNRPHCVCPKDASIFEEIHEQGPNSN